MGKAEGAGSVLGDSGLFAARQASGPRTTRRRSRAVARFWYSICTEHAYHMDYGAAAALRRYLHGSYSLG